MDLDENKPKEATPATSTTTNTKAATQQQSLPWVEKYRPSDLNELISQNHIVTTLTKLIETNRLPHLLFYGPPGTGKTSTILACARKMYGKNYNSMILELNASDDRKIDTVRETIKEFAKTRNMFNTNATKLVILDEADSMTADAQAALRRVIEKYTKTTRFCIICNYIHKINLAIQSRCTKFRFAPLNRDVIKERITHISKVENLQMSPDGLEAIVQLSQGDMRKCLNILQSTFMAHTVVNQETVYTCTGKPLPTDIRKILETLLTAEYGVAVQQIAQMQSSKGLALQDIVTDIFMSSGRLNFPDNAKTQLIQSLAEIEFRLASGGANERLNLGALVAAFVLLRDKVGKQFQQQQQQQQQQQNNNNNDEQMTDA